MRDLYHALAVAACAIVLPIFPAAPASAEERPAAGRFLVAAEDLADPNFTRTIVLLARYGPGGALGVVVNRKTDVRVGEVFPRLEGPATRDHVWSGGPVERNEWGMLLRASEAPDNALKIFADLYLSDDPALLETCVGDPARRGRYRVYAGYAGWGPGQLDAEIARGGWHVVPGEVDVVFSTADESTWRELLPRNPLEWTRRGRDDATTCGGPLGSAGQTLDELEGLVTQLAR